MNFTLTVLGTASAMPMVDRYQSAQVLSVHGRFFLIDCGEGCQRQLMRCHIPLQRIDSLFISHIHGDHIFGLYPLLSTLGMLKRDTPLNIYAPSSFAPILKFFLSYFGEGLAFEIRHIPLQMKGPEVIYKTMKAKYNAWAATYGSDTTGEHEAAFLLNVAQTATPVELRIVDVEVVEGGARIRVAAEAGGNGVDLSKANGAIYVAAGDTVTNLVERTVQGTTFSGDWKTATITVPSAAGTFVKVVIGVSAPAEL